MRGLLRANVSESSEVVLERVVIVTLGAFLLADMLLRTRRGESKVDLRSSCSRSSQRCWTEDRERDGHDLAERGVQQLVRAYLSLKST